MRLHNDEVERAGALPKDPVAPYGIAATAMAEFVGTFILVLVGTAVATAATLGDGTAGPAYDSLSIALSFGLVLVALVGALGDISGAHVNPAVTFGLAIAGRFPWARVPVYMLAQVAGAILAAFVVWFAYGTDALVIAKLGAPAPVNQSTLRQVLTVEALIAFILVFTVLSVTASKARADIAPLTIGFALAAGVLLSGPVSGGAGNPARALGPTIVAQTGDVWYLYVLGPLLGAAIAALVYKAIVRRHEG